MIHLQRSFTSTCLTSYQFVSVILPVSFIPVFVYLVPVFVYLVPVYVIPVFVCRTRRLPPLHLIQLSSVSPHIVYYPPPIS